MSISARSFVGLLAYGLAAQDLSFKLPGIIVTDCFTDCFIDTAIAMWESGSWSNGFMGKGSMSAKKMFPPRGGSGLLGNDYDEVKLQIDFRIQAGQIVMQFSDHVEWVRMRAAGARKLAALLIGKADELDRLPSEIKKS